MQTGRHEIQPETVNQAGSPEDGPYTGVVVYLYAYDIAFDIKQEAVAELLSQPVTTFKPDTSKPGPRQSSFFRPRIVRLPPVERLSRLGLLQMERTVKLFPIGAISLAIQVPFRIQRLETLVDYYDLPFNTGTLSDDVKDWAEQIRTQLEPFCNQPVKTLQEADVYTVFCIESPWKSEDGHRYNAERWLQQNLRQIASLLAGQENISLLSNQQADELIKVYTSYYEHDLVVPDWGAALIVDGPNSFQEVLNIIELANVQLTKLVFCDRLLNATLEQSYSHLARPNRAGCHRKLHNLRETEWNLRGLNCELSNMTNIFGGWYLAKIYKNIAEKLYLPNRQRVVNEKLTALRRSCQILRQERTNRWMIILAGTIALFFAVGLFILLLGWWK